MKEKEYNLLSKQILDSAITVHKEMGPGLIESIYKYCLLAELRNRGMKAESQVCLPLFYKGEDLNKDFRMDILIENEIIIEIKAVDMLQPVHEAQIRSFLKLAGKRLGFLINFNVPLLKNGFRRFENNY